VDLVLWRHADAEDGAPDLERKLTAKGHKQAERMARWLRKRLRAKFTVLCSPAARARQTAEALEAPIQISEALAPGAAVHKILELAEWPRHKSGTVVVVGHQPELGRVAAFLMTGSASDWSVKKGGLWWLSHRERAGEAQVVVRAVSAPDLL